MRLGLSRSFQLKAGVILQYLQMTLSAVISLIYTPIMINTLGQSEYGIYNLASSFISYLSILSLGFGGSYLRFYSRYKRNNDDVGIQRLNGLFIITFTLLGFIAFICGMIFTIPSFLKLIFDTGLTQSELDLARVLMIILSFNIAVSFIDSVFSSYITSQEKFVFQKIVTMLKTVLSPFCTIPLLLLGNGSIVIALVTTCVSIFASVLNILYCLFKLKMKFKFTAFDHGLFKEIFLFSLFIAINQIVDQINWQTDKIILGRFKGSDEVAVYSISATINTLYINLSSAISSVFSPVVNRIIANKDKCRIERLNGLFIKVGRIQFIFLMLILTGFIFFGQYFIQVWAGEGFEASYFVALILIIPATIPMVQNIGIEIQRGLNKHQFRSIVYLGMAIINVIISIFMVQYFGAIGAAAGTCISFVIANGFVMNIYYYKKLNINVLSFRKSICKILPGLIVPILLGIVIKLFVPINNIVIFLLLIILYSLVYCVSVYFLGMNEFEKKLVKKPFIIIMKKIKHKNK